ncbi:hypothetical protein Emed_006365 [Eimeria media]
MRELRILNPRPPREVTWTVGTAHVGRRLEDTGEASAGGEFAGAIASRAVREAAESRGSGGDARCRSEPPV